MKNRIRDIPIYSILIIFAVIFIFPYLWMISSSLKHASDINTMSLIPKSVVTGKYYFTLVNYATVFSRLNLGLLFYNTLFIALINTIANLFLNSLAAYSFARFKFPGRDIIFKLMLSGLMVPGAVLLIPNLFVIRFFGIYNTRLALILPFIMSVYNIFLMRQAFLNALKETEESARIEGCSRFKIFYRISLPQQKPVLITLGIFTFLYNYNSFLFPLMYINDPKKYTMQLALAAVAVHDRGTNYDILLAASVVVSIPLILLFLIFQKYIVEGITVGSLKG